MSNYPYGVTVSSPNRDSFTQGASTGEREGTPLYGSPAEAYRVSGGGVPSLIPPDTGTRRAPIRGTATTERLGGTHGVRVTDGAGMVEHPSEFELQGLVAERMAANLSMPQAAHSIIRQQRGDGQQDYPDGGTGRGTGRVKAVHSYVGVGYARPAAEAHDPVDTDAPTDYIAHPEGLDRYVGAKSLLAAAGFDAGGASFPAAEHRGSQFECMGEDILNGLPNG